MNLNDFLHSVKGSLEPDLPRERKAELSAGDPPKTYEERAWLEWQQ